MKKTPIYFRADGHSQMGLGHVIRSLALASALSTRFDCKFIIQNPTDSVRQLIKKVCEIIELPEMTLFNEAKELAAAIFTGQEILVLDGYHFDANYQQLLKSHVGKMVCIDDIHSTHFHADVVINHAEGVSPKDYSADSRTRFYLGFDYLLLRKPFLDTAANEHIVRNKQNTFICLGGADPNNETISVLKKAVSKKPNEHFFVIVGAAYQGQEELLAFKNSSSSKITVLQNLDAAILAKVMKQCATAITSPSTVALEYLAIGGNLYLHQIADNQSRIFNFLTKTQAGFSFDQFDEIQTNVLNQSKLVQQTLIDGKSSIRLVGLFNELDFEIQLNLREAMETDLTDYFDLANDSLTRQNSFNAQQISLSTHTNWFDKKRTATNTRMYVLEYQGNFAGQIRFDFTKKATLSYAIAAAYRGRGLGKILLKKGLEKFRKEVNSSIEIEGFVKKENIASNRIFQNLGFLQLEANTIPNAFRYLDLNS